MLVLMGDVTERAGRGESEMDRDCRSELEVEVEDDVCCIYDDHMGGAGACEGKC